MYTAFHNHSFYSALDGFSSPKEYLDRAKEIELKGFQISEHANQYSWPYFDKLKTNYPEIKMIYGAELYETPDLTIKDSSNKYHHLLVTCINEKSRIAMNEIITKSNLEGFYYRPRTTLEMLRPYADSLIISSACLGSRIGREQDETKCIQIINEYKSIFPYFYLEIMPHDHMEQELYNQRLIRLSRLTNTPFIITCDSHSATKEDLLYQSKLVRIARDEDTLEEIYQDCYLQSEDEIHAVLDKQIGIDNVNLGLSNTNDICDMIENVSMPFQSPKLPHYPLPKEYKNNHEYLTKLAYDGLEIRGYDKLTVTEQNEWNKRLQYELEMIDKMGFSGYFLIVADLVQWAKTHNVMVGPGRGSAGGSIVCYLIGIVELDPIKYGLIFERFLNPERVSMPDIDLDFDDREKIVQYLTDKYGDDRVCQIINYSYITPIVAIKDTARILNIPYSVAEVISKKFTYETFDECIENNKSFLENYTEPEYQELFKIAGKLFDRLRHVSVHAGGVGIVDTKISDYMGMKLGAKNEKVIEVDKKMSEEIGIIKFDILGISTLSVIKEIINDTKIDLWDIDPNNEKFINDKQTYDLLKSANTNGVFQIESSGMKDLLLRLKPDNINDVSAVLALYRPDSMEFLEDYIKYKHNPETIEVWHKDMLPVVQDTYGCIVYQEQLMNIVRIFGGRTMGGADLFRKAIGKKDVSLVKKESDKLLQEIKNNGYDNDLAIKISEYLSNKGGYMFNLSHSMLYSVIALQTAYLKVHYPLYFYKALLNQNKTDYGTLNKYIIDAINYGIKIMPPSLIKSERNFSTSDNKILFGLEAIKGIGSKLVDQIMEERQKKQFDSFTDFINRTNPTVAQVVALIKSGATGSKNKRKDLLRYAESLFLEKPYTSVSSLPSNKILKEKYNIEFEKSMDKDKKLSLYNNIRKNDYNNQQKEKRIKHIQNFINKYMQDEDLWEFETLSFFIEKNPFEKAYQYLTTSVEDVDIGNKCVMVGLVSDITKKIDRNGKQFCYMNIYSTFGLKDVIVWHQVYRENQDILKKDNQLALLCKKIDGDKLVVEKIKPYNVWLSERKQNLT